ncbi:hypothetical protein J3L11_11750 [Shewanella sp. 4t3-1-2LB]|uniref:HEPN domain-containing protein n=1 Tax=Shewanella sp. 4t3-1-2LB TaxID=2817682 RepID=UPI001A988865|nr:HEPN domain-containing protein [Shewanella sp. 4t3-1-2LB]MBO1272319.1 hypothetical protein [Shewanella sp. 4t3-1-2LB]
MEFTGTFKRKFEALLEEFGRTHLLWCEDHKAYFEETRQDGLIFSTIDAPEDMREDIATRRKNDEPHVPQLYGTKLTESLIAGLSEILHKTNDIKCLDWELNTIVKDCAYELINTHFLDKSTEGEDYFKKLSVIFEKRLHVFKTGFKRFRFQFPVKAFQGAREMRLTKNIQMISIDPNELVNQELESYKRTRLFGCNFYIEVTVPCKCSLELSKTLAKRSMLAMCNSLKLLSAGLFGGGVPIISSIDTGFHMFDFYRFGEVGGQLDSSRTTTFLDRKIEEFWDELAKSKDDPNLVFHVVLNIPELLLIPNFKEANVLELIERSLIWFGDSVSESNELQRIQKIVTSIETLVNFKEHDTTETFKSRVKDLNLAQPSIDGDVYAYSGLLYGARSDIVHGEPFKNTLNFDYVRLCSGTLINAICYFSLFGLTATGFKNKLPAFIDDIKNRIP